MDLSKLFENKAIISFIKLVVIKKEKSEEKQKNKIILTIKKVSAYELYRIFIEVVDNFCQG